MDEIKGMVSIKSARAFAWSGAVSRSDPSWSSILSSALFGWGDIL